MNSLEEQEQFGAIPLHAVIRSDVLDDNKLSNGAKLLYLRISQLTTREGYCWASNRWLSESIGVSERTIRRYLDELDDRTLIFIELEDNNKRKIFLDPFGVFKYEQSTGKRVLCFPDYFKIKPNINRADNFVQDINRADTDVQGGGQNCPPINIKNNRSLNSKNELREADSPSEVVSFPKEKRKRRKKSKCPIDFFPSETILSEISKTHPTVTKIETEKELTKFVSHYTELDGCNKRRVSWDKEFFDWIERGVGWGKIGKVKKEDNGVSQRVVPTTKKPCQMCRPDKLCNFHNPDSAYNKDRMEKENRRKSRIGGNSKHEKEAT